MSKFLHSYLSESDLKTIEDSVKGAEQHTSAEIVPVLVGSSVPDFFLSMLAFLYALAVWIFAIYVQKFYILESYSIWSNSWDLVLAFGLYFAIYFHCKSPKRSLKYIVKDQVLSYFTNVRAELEFSRVGIRKTKDATGVMLFISFKERKVFILTDESISKLLPQEYWDKQVGDLIKNIRQKKMAYGISQCIAGIGKELSVHFPIKADDKNELRNALVIKE